MNYLKEKPVDLIFLDIQMENLSGIEFLTLLKKKPCVILTTASDSYALEAFDLDVDVIYLNRFLLIALIKLLRKYIISCFCKNNPCQMSLIKKVKIRISFS